MRNRTLDSSWHHRLRFGQEIALALILKIVLLSVLWLVFFRHDPSTPKPSVADLFASSPVSSTLPGERHAIR